jgi:hypothetical protein
VQNLYKTWKKEGSSNLFVGQFFRPIYLIFLLPQFDTTAVTSLEAMTSHVSMKKKMEKSVRTQLNINN